MSELVGWSANHRNSCPPQPDLETNNQAMIETVTGPVVLIPALSPDGRLVGLVHELRACDLTHVIIVDDGSSASCAPIFEELAAIPGCTVLHHDVNRGKGHALKTGMRFFAQAYPDSVGLVSADCDGQHKAVDIKRVADELVSHPRDLILGAREFPKHTVPLRSRFGNTLTRVLFRLLTGLAVADTQTGLRGIPASEMELFESLKGEHFEYELSMLLACKQHNIAIRQLKIATIYLDENSGSHFNPFLDSIKIYLVLLKFVSSSLISFAVDYGSFLLLLGVLGQVLTPNLTVFWAGIGARVISSTVNYTVNRTTVFKSAARLSTLRYYGLCVVLMLVSSGSVTLLHAIAGGGAWFFKIIVDSLLFVASFTVQREWVFAKRADRE